MDALEGYRIHPEQNNLSKGTRSTIRIHKIILIITTESFNFSYGYAYLYEAWS